MRMDPVRFRRTTLALAFAAIGIASWASAQDKPKRTKSDVKPAQPPAVQEKPAENQPLPEAEKLLDTFVEVTGGKKAYEKLTTRTASGTFSIDALGVKGKMQTWQKAADRMRSTVDMGELGKSDRGVERGVAWENSTLSGPRLLDGAEKAFMLREATFNADLNWRKLCKSVKTVGEFEVAGKPAWKIEAVTNDGATLHLYYNQYSNLLVQIDANVITAMGEVSVQVLPSDYRKVGEILVPHRSTQKMMGITQVAEFTSIAFNQPIPDDKFTPPAEVRPMLTRGNSKAAEKRPAGKAESGPRKAPPRP